MKTSTAIRMMMRRACRLCWRPAENFGWRRFLTTALFGLALASSTATAAAQPAGPSPLPLTMDSVMNAAYLSPAEEVFGGSRLFPLTDGNYPSDSTPEALTVDADGFNIALFNNPQISATGDLNGDGAQDIVTIFIESRTDYSFVWVVEAYLNQDGQAVPAAAIVGGNRASEPTSLSIQSGLISLSGLTVGGNDPMCCPSHPFTQVLSLQGDQLVDVSAPPAAQPATPASTAPDLSPLKSFPGAVLVLPVDQPPYASWAFQGVQTDPTTYVETVGSSSQGIGVDAMSIGASVGQSAYDPRADFKPTCQPATPYCYFPPFGQSSGAEIFNGLKARGTDAFVLHKTFPSEMWSLWWFDKTSNTSYTLTFGGNDVITLFEPLKTFNKNNVTAAQNLAAMADKLIPWTGT